jgi:segregation and condensation protein B
MPIDVLIEGLLFYKSAPQKKQTILKLFEITEVELGNAITTLNTRLQNGATRLVETTDEIQLVTAPELAPVIEALRKSELKADIGKAGAETLAIILYQEPITRAEIDRIRGVNSSFILRNLMIRGLVNRTHNKSRGGFEFTISPALLAHLGITHKGQLPDFANVANALENFNIEATSETALDADIDESSDEEIKTP